MLETKICRKIFSEDYDDYERTDTLGTEDAVIILNPTKYTLKEDDEESSLAQENDMMLDKKVYDD